MHPCLNPFGRTLFLVLFCSKNLAGKSVLGTRGFLAVKSELLSLKHFLIPSSVAPMWALNIKCMLKECSLCLDDMIYASTCRWRIGKTVDNFGRVWTKASSWPRTVSLHNLQLGSDTTRVSSWPSTTSFIVFRASLGVAYWNGQNFLMVPCAMGGDVCFGELHIAVGCVCGTETIQNARCKIGLRRLLTTVVWMWKVM